MDITKFDPRFAGVTSSLLTTVESKYGKVVSTVNHRDHLYVACEFAVFRLDVGENADDITWNLLLTVGDLG